MLSSQKIKRCFFIGPMRDMQRLLTFREQVLKPLLLPHGFTVDTPDVGDIGNIMRQVLLGLEQADILVADITNNNPNVMYELGIYHAFGKPSLVIKENGPEKDSLDTPFDIAEYRFHPVDFQQPDAARERLKPLVEGIINRMDRTDWFGNPVTDFYNSPIAEIPTAIGLFKNYRKNFLDMFLPSVFQKDENDTYTTKIFEEITEEGKSVNRLWTTEERDQVTVEIAVPEELNMTAHSFIAGLKSKGELHLRIAKVQKPGRPFSISYRVDHHGNKCIVDIPTVLSTLNESIEQRRIRHQAYFDNVEWELLEQQEIERFHSRCESYINDLEKKHPECKGKVRILTQLPA